MTQDAQSQIAAPKVHAGRPLAEVRAERRELESQLDALRTEHRQVRLTITGLPRDAREQQILHEQVLQIDERIASVEQMLAINASEMGVASPDVVTTTGVPTQPSLPRIPDEYVALGSLFMLITLLPLSIAFARRVWKRDATAVSELPTDVVARLGRMENAIDATAIEVERIGEGQRFVTQLMNEQRTLLKEGATQSALIDKAREQGMQRQATPH